MLEYAAPVWSPWFKKDIKALESVQVRCLKLTKANTELESLQGRRETTDLVETYKLLNGHYKSNPENFFSNPNRQLRGHSSKLFVSRSKTEVRRNFFSNRVVKPWNKLPEDVVAAPTLDEFKQML